MSSDKLILMANQIAAFYATQAKVDQADAVAKHLKSFWEPRMLRQFHEMIDAGSFHAHPLVLQAAELLRSREAA